MQFKSELYRPTKVRWSGYGRIEAGEIAEEVLGTKLDGGRLFAYMFRRFGYPNCGWDPDKDLVQYAITTPHPKVLLVVRPYMGIPDSDMMFTMLLYRKLQMKCMDEEMALRRSNRQKYIYELASEWCHRKFVPEFIDDKWVMRPKKKGEKGWVMRKHPRTEQDSAVNELLMERYDIAFPISERPDRPYEKEKLLELNGNRGEVYRAIAVTVNDLLRPTSIRDTIFNIRGDETTENFDKLVSYDKSTSQELDDTEVYKYAGTTAKWAMQYERKNAPPTT